MPPPLLVLCCLLLSASWLQSQSAQPYFDAYDADDGLGAEAINDLLTDRYGYLWTAAYSGVHRFDGYDFVNYTADVLDSCALSHVIARCLAEDDAGYLWVGTASGLNRLDRASGCFRRYFHDPNDEASIPANDIQHLVTLPAGRLLVITTGGVARYHPAQDSFERLPHSAPFPSRGVRHGARALVAGPAGLFVADGTSRVARFAAPTLPEVFALYSFSDSLLLLGTSAGLYTWEEGDSLILPPFGARSLTQKTTVLDILPGRLHRYPALFLASRGDGLGFYDLFANDGIRFEHEGKGTFSLMDNHVRALVDDDQGGVWVGTYSGLNHLTLRPDRPRFYLNKGEYDGSQSQVLELHATPAGAVFSYERRRGLYRSDRLGQPPQRLDFPLNDFLNSRDLNHFHTDRQGITWIARGHDALYRYDNTKRAFLAPITHPDFSDRRLNAIYQDLNDDDRYWLATSRGLGCLQLSTNTLRWFLPSDHLPGVSGEVIATMLPTSDGKIWCSAGDYYNDRVGYFSQAEQRFFFYDYQPGNLAKSAGGRIKQLAARPDGTLWAATSNGLIEIKKNGDYPTLHTSIGGEPTGAIEAVLADSTGVWISAANRLAHYRPADGSIEWFSGAPITQFNNSVATHLPDGSLLFGGIGGLARAEPKRLAGQPSRFPAIVFNGVLVDGAPLRTSTPWPELRHLNLPLGKRNLILRFSALAFGRASTIEYGYRLNGDVWKPLGQERSLSFADLRPGRHLLELRATDGRGHWPQAGRELVVLVPHFWYERQAARLAGLLLVAALLFWLIRTGWQRRAERQKLAQLQELDAFKNRLLTNLTHEFRTPLTLILGPARRLRTRARQTEDPTLAREARRIDRQGRKLLELINQLLDLRRTTRGEFTLTRSVVELSRFLEEVVLSHAGAAEEKNISLLFSEAEPLPPPAHPTSGRRRAGTMKVDKAKVESIVGNLIANAIKFTPAGGQVSVRLATQEYFWELRVADTGPGIPPADREAIFQRFLRLPNAPAGGSGIGLALAAELTQLLGGSISVSDAVGGGAEFLLSLPVHRAHQKALTPPGADTALPPVEARPLPQGKATPRLLIVEDDDEVRSFLAESLDGVFRVLLAKDGLSGLDLARRELPDLVVSDVMMPGLDGLQLCGRLKGDPLTSHLPVLLLTARTAEEHRLDGLERGADAYLSKPFLEKELHLRLRNLLALRERTAAHLRAEWFSAGPLPPTVPPLSATEAGWLTELRSYISQNLDNPELKGADLERHLAMSRSQLHRKLSSVLGLSPTRLINELRLVAAAQRLAAGATRVSEVAYACGFRDPGYFGRKFKEKFGVAPSDFTGHDGSVFSG